MRSDMHDSMYKAGSYLEYRRKYAWHENSLATSDEDISGKFDWKQTRLFGPYIARYKLTVIASILLMLVYTGLNIANPYLIGVAIDQFIKGGDLRGLAWISIALLIVNIAMSQLLRSHADRARDVSSAK